MEKYFNIIQHKILIDKVSKYTDQSTKELIGKLTKVGYVDIHNLNDRKKYAVKGITQGSIISPLLSNLYLDELDKFVAQTLMPKWNRGEKRGHNREY